MHLILSPGSVPLAYQIKISETLLSFLALFKFSTTLTVVILFSAVPEIEFSGF